MALNKEALRNYGERYGYLSLPARIAGRVAPRLWSHIGSISTASSVRRQFLRYERRILNLGSGSHLIKECLNADIDPRADLYLDARRPLPFPAQSIDDIYSEEMIEHILEAEGLALLGECYRVLKPGGRIRISTPDLDYFASRIADADARGEEMNNVFYNHGHCYLYTRGRLRDALLASGFLGVKLSFYRDPSSALSRFDSHAERYSHVPEISQFVDALK